MSITVKQAYEIVLDIFEDFSIYACRELNDYWLFAWEHKDGTPILLPPIRVSKENGEVDLHDECASAFLNHTCREEGKIISLEEIQKMTE